MYVQRTRLSLNGTWQFWADPEGAFSSSTLKLSHSSEVSVPAPLQSQREDLHLYTGPAWYRRTFDLPAGWSGSPIYLGFDAVDDRAEIWLNNARVGDHSGGYLPFELDVTQAAHPGENIIIVRVTDPPEGFAEIPHGKQSWYGPLSGLWQGVWFEQRAAFHLRSLSVKPDPATGQVDCTAVFSAPAPAGARLSLRLTLPSGQEIDAGEVSLAPGSLSAAWVTRPPEILRWSPQFPNLFKLEAHLFCLNEELDVIARSFGFRSIETRTGRLYLNGELLYLRGALDQDYYPGTICTPPSRAFVEDEMRKAKALGLNCLRIHIKVPDPVYYEVADRLGMLVWAELPNFSVLTGRSAELARQTLAGILERDGHHPSIIAWSIINEGWGLDLVNDASHRRWLADTYTWLKQRESARLVVDNSACPPNFHLHSDLDDFHHYRGMPDHRRQWLEFVGGFAARPGWTYSPDGDALRSGTEPLVVSEFGNWGLPDANLLLDRTGREPWWFDSGLDWGDGAVYPHGVQARFHSLGLDRVFENWEGFIAATQWHQFDALKFEIESLRLRPEIQGYVITELTDVHWECNGLMDMQRRVKAYGQALASINADTVIIPSVERTAWWSDEPVHVALHLAHGASKQLTDCRLRWHAPAWGAEGNLPVPEVQPGEVVSLGYAVLPASGTARPARERLTLELLGSQGEKLAANFLELSLYPRKRPAGPDGRALWSPNPRLAEQLARARYNMAATQETASLLVASQANRDLVEAVGNGARLLLLAEDKEALRGGLFGLGLTAREGTLWSGDWVSSFGWLRRKGPFAAFPGGPLLDESFEPVIPELNLNGFGLSDYQSSLGGEPAVYAGQFLGWIHKPAAWIGRRPWGQGQMVVSTFRLQGEDKAANPAAAALLDSLVALAETLVL
jgi:hypothetical protein